MYTMAQLASNLQSGLFDILTQRGTTPTFSTKSRGSNITLSVHHGDSRHDVQLIASEWVDVMGVWPTLPQRAGLTFEAWTMARNAYYSELNRLRDTYCQRLAMLERATVAAIVEPVQMPLFKVA